MVGYYTIFYFYAWKFSHTYIKDNKVVSKEHKGLHNQKCYIQSHYLLSAIGMTFGKWLKLMHFLI